MLSNFLSLIWVHPQGTTPAHPRPMAFLVSTKTNLSLSSTLPLLAEPAP